MHVTFTKGMYALLLGRKKEFILGPLLFCFLQLKRISMPKRHIWGEHILIPFIDDYICTYKAIAFIFSFAEGTEQQGTSTNQKLSGTQGTGAGSCHITTLLSVFSPQDVRF